MNGQLNCQIIEDLLPLYVDGCCSQESKKEVERHLENCKNCNEIYECMSADTQQSTPVNEIKLKPQRINDWKASLLQSVLLFVSFGLIVLGVSIEAETGYFNMFNGFWAFFLVIPATAFMLSMVNWCFIRLYKSKKQFSNTSCLLTVALTVLATAWAVFHYEINVDFFETISTLIKDGNFFFVGLLFFGLLMIVLSKKLSNKFADLLGKI